MRFSLLVRWVRFSIPTYRSGETKDRDRNPRGLGIPYRLQLGMHAVRTAKLCMYPNNIRLRSISIHAKYFPAAHGVRQRQALLVLLQLTVGKSGIIVLLTPDMI